MTSDQRREFAAQVAKRLQDAGFRALWAGGCVRDFLLGRDPKDYDVATDARPEDVRKLFGYRRTLAVGASFGVIVVRGPQGAGQVEVATFRTEGPYLDGRRPEHVTFCSPEEDAQRRDFTINGMFYDPIAQKPLDFVEGEKDLSAGIVRAIGNPHDRMREDKLRLLRAVRFAATFDFELDPTTADAIRNMADELHVVSVERISQELTRMLVDPHRMRAMRLAADVNLLQVIIPELASAISGSAETRENDAWEITLQMLQLLQEPSFALSAAVLLHALHSEATPDRVRKICRRLKFSNRDIDHIDWLVAQQDALIDAPNLPLATLKRFLSHAQVKDLLSLNRVRILARNADLSALIFCEEYLRNTPAEEINPPPLLTGDLLIAEGFSSGPEFKQYLETVRVAQLNGEIDSTAQALKLVRQLHCGDDGDK